MKSFLISLFVIFSLQASAQANDISHLLSWQCSGNNIEGAGTGPDQNGKLTGSVSWDCFPGDGICSRETAVSSSFVSSSGELIFAGTGFKLSIHTEAKRSADGSYSASLSATGEGPEDDGGGMHLAEKITCQPQQ